MIVYERQGLHLPFTVVTRPHGIIAHTDTPERALELARHFATAQACAVDGQGAHFYLTEVLNAWEYVDTLHIWRQVFGIGGIGPQHGLVGKVWIIAAPATWAEFQNRRALELERIRVEAKAARVASGFPLDVPELVALSPEGLGQEWARLTVEGEAANPSYRRIVASVILEKGEALARFLGVTNEHLS